MRPVIRKQDGQWVVTRPGYGFNPQPTVSRFASWREAVTSLRSAPASAGSTTERGFFQFGLTGRYGWSRRGLIRMEDT